MQQNTVTAPDSSVTPLSQQQLPQEITFKGDLEGAYKWIDELGENILVLSSSTSSVYVKELQEGEHSKELFAKHFIIKNGKPEVLWDMYDSEKKCIFDLTSDFISTDITDLDVDGTKETIILYKLACRSDASPARMKLILHEGKTKYALRGDMILRSQDMPDSLFSDTREIDLSKISKQELENTMMRSWGCYESANDFKSAPPAFIEYCRTFWRNNSEEKF